MKYKYVICLILFFCIILSGCESNEYDDPRYEDPLFCIEDSDCVHQPTCCCGTCVNKYHYREIDRRNDCVSVMCTMVICEFHGCRCVDNKCIEKFGVFREKIVFPLDLIEVKRGRKEIFRYAIKNQYEEEEDFKVSFECNIAIDDSNYDEEVIAFNYSGTTVEIGKDEIKLFSVELKPELNASLTAYQCMINVNSSYGAYETRTFYVTVIP